LPPKIQEFSRKKVQNLCFYLLVWAVLTSVDESKRLNPAESRITYTTYCEVKKSMIFEEEDEWEEGEDEEWEEEEW
jgi:hypothetical protein